jgi:aerobic C4-dicarboxylate transport protein
MSNPLTGAEALTAPPKKLPWYRKLGMQVLLSLVLGIAVGFCFPSLRRNSSYWAICFLP